MCFQKTDRKFVQVQVRDKENYLNSNSKSSLITLNIEGPQVNIVIKEKLRLWRDRLSHQNIKYATNIFEKHNLK